MQPGTRYAKSGDVHIAYQVFGEGPLNLVLVPPFFSNVEGWWDEPDYTRALVLLGSYAKVLIFDKRGTACRIGSPSFQAWSSVSTTCGRLWTLSVWNRRR